MRMLRWLVNSYCSSVYVGASNMFLTRFRPLPGFKSQTNQGIIILCNKPKCWKMQIK